MKQNRDPEVYLHKYSQVIFDKGANAIQMRKNSISINGAEKMGYPLKKKNLNTHLILFTKISSKRINCRPKM